MHTARYLHQILSEDLQSIQSIVMNPGHLNTQKKLEYILHECNKRPNYYEIILYVLWLMYIAFAFQTRCFGLSQACNKHLTGMFLSRA